MLMCKTKVRLNRGQRLQRESATWMSRNCGASTAGDEEKQLHYVPRETKTLVALGEATLVLKCSFHVGAAISLFFSIYHHHSIYFCEKRKKNFRIRINNNWRYCCCNYNLGKTLDCLNRLNNKHTTKKQFQFTIICCLFYYTCAVVVVIKNSPY